MRKLWAGIAAITAAVNVDDEQPRMLYYIVVYCLNLMALSFTEKVSLFGTTMFTYLQRIVFK
jgi:hypothetical protein